MIDQANPPICGTPGKAMVFWPQRKWKRLTARTIKAKHLDAMTPTDRRHVKAHLGIAEGN